MVDKLGFGLVLPSLYVFFVPALPPWLVGFAWLPDLVCRFPVVWCYIMHCWQPHFGLHLRSG